ncbi:MAG: ABC transporter substrate-binding protein [Caldilineaceae bacterium]|jgi:peptide/nickel transport system substrate-binding protein
MFKKVVYFLLFSLIFVLVSACIAPQTPAANEAANAGNGDTGASRGILRVPHFLARNGAESLDPASPTEFSYANYLLYDRLVALNADGVLEPELATAWATNADATEWTFTLREGVTFHDGSAFDSADVAYTFAHILDPETKSRAARTLSLITGTETPDPQTIVFRLEPGHADFPLLLSSRPTAIIPADSGATIATSGIGTGPFKLEALDPEGTTVFSANDNYWRGAPGLAGIEMPAIADNEARTLALQAGQIDLLLQAGSTAAELLTNSPDHTVLSFPTGTWNGLSMRIDMPPFDDVRVRQAIRLVADRQAMVDLILNGAGRVSCDTPVDPADPYRWEPEGGCPQNIEGAKALLAEAGYADGLELTLYTSDVLPNLVPMGEVFQQQAAAAGINITLEVAPADTFFSETAVKEAFITTGWLGRPTDEILNLVFRSTSPLNEAKFVNEAFDKLLDEARQAQDLAKRTKFYQDAQQLIATEGGHMIAMHINEITIVSNAVANFPARTVEHIEWYEITKSE